MVKRRKSNKEIPSQFWITPEPEGKKARANADEKVSLVVDNLADLDAAIEFIDAQFRLSNDLGRAAAEKLRYVFSDELPSDPQSEAYMTAQQQRYLMLSGRESYTLDNEHTEFNFDVAVKRPYPFLTDSALTISEYFIAL